MIIGGNITTPPNDDGFEIINGVPATRHNGLFVVNGLSDRISSYIGSPTARLSTVDGNAFAWISEKDLAPYLGYKAVFTDSAGKEATGYIKEPDVVEALGSELFVNSDFEDVTPAPFDGWSQTTPGDGAIDDEGTIVHGGSHAAKLSSNTTGTSTRLYQNLSFTEGKLYKYGGWSRGDGTTPGRVQVTDFMSQISTGIPGVTYAEYGFYFTATATAAKITYLFAGNLANAVVYFDDVSIKEVTDVGATGVHIVSAKDGTTRNWASIDSGFDPNDIDFVYVYDK